MTRAYDIAIRASGQTRLAVTTAWESHMDTFNVAKSAPKIFRCNEPTTSPSLAKTRRHVGGKLNVKKEPSQKCGNPKNLMRNIVAYRRIYIFTHDSLQAHRNLRRYNTADADGIPPTWRRLLLMTEWRHCLVTPFTAVRLAQWQCSDFWGSRASYSEFLTPETTYHRKPHIHTTEPAIHTCMYNDYVRQRINYIQLYAAHLKHELHDAIRWK